MGCTRYPLNKIHGNGHIPIIKKDKIFKSIQQIFYRLPFYQNHISAGFPSPADGEMEAELDLNDLLIKHPSATFLLRVSGVSMIKVGIHHNDILIVDRSLEPRHQSIVIAAVNGELTVKRLLIEGNKVRLVAENDSYQPIDITDDMQLHIWGVVIHVIHSLKT